MVRLSLVLAVVALSLPSSHQRRNDRLRNYETYMKFSDERSKPSEFLQKTEVDITHSKNKNADFPYISQKRLFPNGKRSEVPSSRKTSSLYRYKQMPQNDDVFENVENETFPLNSVSTKYSFQRYSSGQHVMKSNSRKVKENRRRSSFRRYDVRNGARMSSANSFDIRHSTSTLHGGEVNVKHKKSMIRHRRSRKSFIRNRKTPKLRDVSQKFHHDENRTKHSEETEELTTSGSKKLLNNNNHFQDLQTSRALPFQDTNIGHGPKSDESYISYQAKDEFDVNDDITLEPGDISAQPADNFSVEFTLDSLEVTDENFFNSSSMSKDVDNSRDTMDVVTKFLRIIEAQQAMGENCTKGTASSLGDGIVDKYAHERFRLQADITVNRANLYTRLWKYSREQVLKSAYLLHAEVLSLIEFSDDIVGAGNCYDRYRYPDYDLFCPFAHRLPNGSVQVKDLAQQYFYLTNTSDFFLDAKQSGERVIENYSQIRKGERVDMVWL